MLRELKSQSPNLVVEAYGGKQLEAAGATLLADTVSNARMGIGAFLRTFEVLGLLKSLRKRWETVGPPRLVICCDSWTMNKHFAKLAKEFGAAVLYYISPQVWASREKRTEKMAGLIDRLACILPFEETFLRDRGVNATFVGHPLFDALPPAPGDMKRNEPPVVVMPAGSRRRVAADNFSRQLGVARWMREQIPGLRLVTPTVDATDAVVRELAEGLDWVDVRLNDFDDTVRSADLSICVSGTATLHCVALGTPTIALYYVRRWQYAVFKRLVKTDTFVLVNLLHPQKKHVVPEFIPWFGDPGPVATMSLDWLNSDQLQMHRDEQVAVVESVRKQGAARNVATMALELLNAAR